MKGEDSASKKLLPQSSIEENDADARLVPQMSKSPSAAATTEQGASNPASTQPPAKYSRKRSASNSEKEHKRLKRLLRNRVSAQQARERKKVYLSDLEIRGRELEQRNAELEEKVSTLQRENFMLRQIVKNTTLKKSAEGASEETVLQ